MLLKIKSTRDTKRKLKIIPRGIAIILNILASSITILNICFLLAPILLKAPNSFLRSDKLIVKELRTIKTQNKLTTIRIRENMA